MLYAVIGFAVVAATILARRFAAGWRRESARIDRFVTTCALSNADSSDLVSELS